MVDKKFCMSSFLSFRYIVNENVNFRDDLVTSHFKPVDNLLRLPCKTWQDIDFHIKSQFVNKPHKKYGLLLSGGMDSAILAAYMPAGSIAYTLKSLAEGSIDETQLAKKYADQFSLEHKIIELTWNDLNSSLPKLMKQKGAPVHSIEPQIYKAAMLAREDGIDEMIVGESADLIFGGMDQLLSKDWNYDDWISRYTFVDPFSVLKDPVSMDKLFEKYRIDNNKIDFLLFMDEIFSIESSGSYLNAFRTADMNYFDPYSRLVMTDPLDLNRVRSGDSKYMIRELFSNIYPQIPVPAKIPMPRAVNQWLKNYVGSSRPEFIENCAEKMTGDQKWLIYCLSEFLDFLENGTI